MNAQSFILYVGGNQSLIDDANVNAIIGGLAIGENNDNTGVDKPNDTNDVAEDSQADVEAYPACISHDGHVLSHVDSDFSSYPFIVSNVSILFC